MACISWLKWPDPIIDYGRELYVPWRISVGELLYRDIPHLYGPLAHHVNALLFALFGTGLKTLVVFNLLLIVMLTLCLYGIFRRAFDRFSATLCGMVFLGVFAFGRYTAAGNFNFVCPYSHEVTYGLMLYFLVVPTFERYHEQRACRWAVAAGFLLGLISLTKIEVFAAALFSLGAAFLFSALRTGFLKSFDTRAALSVCAGFAVPLFLFGAFFAQRTTAQDAAGMLAMSFSSIGLAPIVTSDFYRALSGLDKPMSNLTIMSEVAVIYIVLLLGLFFLSKLAARIRGFGRLFLVLSAVILPFGIAAWWGADRTAWLDKLGRPWPIFVFLYSLWVIVSVRAGTGAPGNDRRDILRVAVSAFSLFLLLKVVLKVSPVDYGFALSMPAALIVVAVITHHLPRVVERWGGDGLTAKVLVAALVVFFVGKHMNASKTMYDGLTYPVGKDSDRFYTFRPDTWNIGLVINETLTAIEARISREAGFVVIPEGVMLNYLARRRNPGRWFEFAPPYIAAMGEERMCRDLEAGRPDYVLLTERPTREHGAVYFGNDYGFKLKAWVMEHYSPVFVAGGKLFSYQGDFGIVIAKRTPEPR